LLFRLSSRNLIGALALAGAALAPQPGAAPVAQSQENLRYAAIVMDATSGEVLFSRFADERRYPASITKVMTLYLTFEALAEGRAKLDDVIVVSPKAAAQAPSKLGLQAGQTITLDDAMRATVIRSCNDMAMALAEHIGGSEARFGEMMTAKARQLGMSRSRFYNPNGLPDPRQVTTARDLAILSRAVMRDYPQYYKYFGLHDWSYEGRQFRNTNGLLNTGRGYDGIKTGFTNASGYNLAASAVRNGDRLITVVLGGRTVASRNQHLAELMDTGFELEERRERGERIPITQAFFEQKGYGISIDNTPVQYASVTDESADEEAGSGLAPSAAPAPSTAVAYASLPPQAAPTPPPAAQPRVQPPAPVQRAEAKAPPNLTARLNGGSGNEPASGRANASAGRPASPPARPAPPAQRWQVQVGAFKEEKVARDWLREIERRFRAQFDDAGSVVVENAGWFRSRFTGFSEQTARAACAELDRRNVTCAVIRPD